MRPYQKLVAWQEAHALCMWVYKTTETFPKTELYRLVDQMCRSASSAPMNIVEAGKKASRKEQARFYETSICSLEELHYQFVLARDLGYITTEKFQEAEDRIGRTSFLIFKLRNACLSFTTSTASQTFTTS